MVPSWIGFCRKGLNRSSACIGFSFRMVNLDVTRVLKPQNKKAIRASWDTPGSWSEGNGSCLSVLLLASSGQILESLTRLYVHMLCQSCRLLKVAAPIAPSCSLLPSPSAVDKTPKEEPLLPRSNGASHCDPGGGRCAPGLLSGGLLAYCRSMEGARASYASP